MTCLTDLVTGSRNIFWGWSQCNVTFSRPLEASIKPHAAPNMQHIFLSYVPGKPIQTECFLLGFLFSFSILFTSIEPMPPLQCSFRHCYRLIEWLIDWGRPTNQWSIFQISNRHRLLLLLFCSVGFGHRVSSGLFFLVICLEFNKVIPQRFTTIEVLGYCTAEHIPAEINVNPIRSRQFRQSRQSR